MRRIISAVLVMWVCGFVLGTTGKSEAALVGRYSFDEGKGTAIHDSSGRNNNGALINERSDTWTSGHTGWGLYFPGVTGSGSTYVYLGNPPDFQLSNALTFTAWVYCTEPGRDAPILAKEGNSGLSYWFGVFYYGFGILLDKTSWYPWDLDWRSTGFLSGSEPSWHHLASTWDGTTAKLYVDGNLVNWTSFSGPLYNTTEPLTIGINSSFNFTAFKGILDEIHIYNKALTDSEILADKNMAPVPEPATMLLIATGLAGLAGSKLRRRGI